MKLSYSGCYKDLMVEFLSVSVGELSFLPKLENYHPEYLVDFSISHLEKLVKKFSKHGHTYFAFMLGVVWGNCIDSWAKSYSKEMSDSEFEEFVNITQSALSSMKSLLGVEDLTFDDVSSMFDFYDSASVIDFDDLVDEIHIFKNK